MRNRKIFLGDMWPELIQWIERWSLKNKLLNTEEMHSLFLARGYTEAMKIIGKAHFEFKKYKID